MLLAGKPFFLGGPDDFAVDNKCSGAVMIEGRNAKDAHVEGSKQGVDERSDRTSLRQYNETAE
jgi:hypothetical protein